MALPDSLSYHVVFDVSRQLPQWWWSFLIPLAIVFVLMRFGAQNRMNQHRWFKRIFVGFAVVFAIVDVMFTWTQYAGQRNALEHGDVRVVEGVVNDFIPQSSFYKYPERFVVMTSTGRYKYSYCSTLGTGGLNRSHGHIRNGVRVRIADRNGIILRLEVARDASGKTLAPELAAIFPKVVYLPVIYAHYGHTVDVPETKGMAVRLVDVVSDMRATENRSCCICNQSGDAVAVVELSDNEVGRQPIRLELHTNRELYEPFTDGDLVVDLAGLWSRTGYSMSSGAPVVPKSDYTAQLMIGRYKPVVAERQPILERIRVFVYELFISIRATT